MYDIVVMVKSKAMTMMVELMLVCCYYDVIDVIVLLL